MPRRPWVTNVPSRASRFPARPPPRRTIHPNPDADLDEPFDERSLAFHRGVRRWNGRQREEPSVQWGDIVVSFVERDGHSRRSRSRGSSHAKIRGQVIGIPSEDEVQVRKLDKDDASYIMQKLEASPPRGWGQLGKTFWIEASLGRHVAPLRFADPREVRTVFKVEDWRPATVTSEGPHLTREQEDRVIYRMKQSIYRGMTAPARRRESRAGQRERLEGRNRRDISPSERSAANTRPHNRPSVLRRGYGGTRRPSGR